MKICIINIHRMVSSGGSEIQCDLIARELCNMGHEVVYITPTGTQDSEIFKRCPYKVVSIDDSIVSFYKCLKIERPDIVYWRSYKRLFLPVSIIIRLLGIKLVFAISHIHDIKPTVFLGYDKKTVKDYLRMLRNMFQTICQRVGYYNCQAMTSLNSDYCQLLPKRNVYFVPNAMQPTSQSFYWPRPYCLWVANLKAPKHPELFVKLATEVERENIDFLMVGRYQSEFDNLSWILEEDKTPNNFFYLGEQDPDVVNGMLKDALFHVHTCEPEGFGNIFIQAWLARKTSVSLKFNPGSVLDGHIGYFCDDNWNDFIDCCQNLIDNDLLRSSMGDNAYFHAKDLYMPYRLGKQVNSVLLDTYNSKNE